jgi:hypothetical protein
MAHNAQSCSIDGYYGKKHCTYVDGHINCDEYYPTQCDVFNDYTKDLPTLYIFVFVLFIAIIILYKIYTLQVPEYVMSPNQKI